MLERERGDTFMTNKKNKKKTSNENTDILLKEKQNFLES